MGYCFLPTNPCVTHHCKYMYNYKMKDYVETGVAKGTKSTELCNFSDISH